VKLFHRPAHTISPTLHREAYSRGSRLKLVVLGALIGGLLTGGSTYAIARVNTQIAHAHAKHRLEHWRAAQIQMAALHTVATHRHWCTRP
jgi:hypothetical protein